MLCVEDWAEIRRLHRAERMPIKAIARVMGISRNTVRAAIASDQPPKTPLLRSTTSAKASQVEASSGRTQYAICSVIDSSIEAARLATGPNLP